MKHIGFTGTRHGMTEAQRTRVASVLDELNAEANRDGDRVAAHHGDCVGADEQFHGLVREQGWAVVGHPSTHNLRAYCAVDKEMGRKPPLDRNKDIVAAADVMIATPQETSEQWRGGTWSTVRAARAARKPLALVWPDGVVDFERWQP